MARTRDDFMREYQHEREPPPVTLDDLCEPADRLTLDIPWLDRDPYPVGYAPTGYETEARLWRRDGVLHLRQFIPDDVIEAYCDAWVDANDLATGRCSPEWNETAYMRSAAVKDLCLYPKLMRLMDTLIGAPMALHLNLLNWRSTTREWHTDSYLNPPGVGAFYIAVWFALEDIRRDAGPFQYVPGSHRWPSPVREKLLAVLGEDGSDPDWPWRSESVLSPLYEAKFEADGIRPVTYLAKRGDVLLWHARLVHQGSRPENPNAERRAAIAHYSSVLHRSDMPKVGLHKSEPCRYFIL